MQGGACRSAAARCVGPRPAEAECPCAKHASVAGAGPGCTCSQCPFGSKGASGPGREGRERLAPAAFALPSEVLYSRRSVRLPGDKSAQVTEQGSPLVYDDDFGICPVDDEHPFSHDGKILRRRTTSTRREDGTIVHASYLYACANPSGVGRTRTGFGTTRSHMTEARRERLLAWAAAAEKRGEDQVRLVVELLDERAMPAVPSRAIVGKHLTSAGRPDHLTPLRQERIAAIRAAREPRGFEFRRFVECNGGSVIFTKAWPRHTVSMACPPAAVREILDHPYVADVQRLGAPSGDFEATDYPCDGTPSRFRPGLDLNNCEGDVFMDGVNYAIGVYPYREAGLTGRGVEGNAAWARVNGTPHLVLATAEQAGEFYPWHPAFLAYDRSNRIAVAIRGLGSIGAVDSFPEPPDGPRHSSLVTSIALGSILDGQDPDISDGDLREARSGVATGALGVVSDTTWANALDVLLAKLNEVGGLDVINYSTTINHGDDNCADDDDARGLDSLSQDICANFLDEAVVVVKSAGNMHGLAYVQDDDGNWVENVCPHGSEVGAPGASPAAISVGALSNNHKTPYEVQIRHVLNGDSSGGRTEDGRAYPSLVVSAYSAGAAYPRTGYDRYGSLGATSGAAPRVAGAAVLFKHWFLEAHPSVADSPGRLISSILNFADGVAYSKSWYGDGGPQERLSVPARNFGLGRFRLKHFGETGRWFFGTDQVTVPSDDSGTVYLSGESARDTIPRDASRLRVTLWWLEVNTGEGERKADIAAILYTKDPETGDFLEFYAGISDGEHVIRFDFDCYDRHKAKPPPTGEVWLLIYADGTPPPFERCAEGRDYRNVEVSWFWETGRDTSKLYCGQRIVGWCGNLLPEAQVSQEIHVSGLRHGRPDVHVDQDRVRLTCEERCGTPGGLGSPWCRANCPASEMLQEDEAFPIGDPT